MSTKVNRKAAPAKKEPAKKNSKTAAPKPEKKRSHEEEIEEVSTAPVADLEEAEEAEEEAEASASASGGGNAAALAAAGGGEMSASFKNFRHHPDMENFYRFIFENDLRHEALAIIDEMIADKAKKKLGKSATK